MYIGQNITNKIFEMKKYLITLLCGIVWIAYGYSQDQASGVYLTQVDFENRKLSYSTADESGTNKIRFNEFIEKPFINIKHSGEKIILFKDDIYAYQKKGKIVRTHNFESYNFLERGMLWI